MCLLKKWFDVTLVFYTHHHLSSSHRCRRIRIFLVAFILTLLYLKITNYDSDAANGDVGVKVDVLFSNRSDVSAKDNEDSGGDQVARQKLPVCIVIGVRKGGTRALLDMIGLHSKVKQARNEVHFFDVEENYEKGLDWYRSQMPTVLPSELPIEKTPAYFHTELVPERVRRMNASILLLVVVRDPVTRLVSDYTQILHNHLDRGLTFRPFEEVALRTTDGSVNTDYDAVRKSLYADHMRRWLQHFPLTQSMYQTTLYPNLMPPPLLQIHVVNGDKLIRQPWREIHRVETFLGLEHEITKDAFYFNATKGFHCVVISTARSSPTPTSEGSKYKKRRHQCLTGSKGRQHPKVSAEATVKLRRFFAKHNYDFYNLVGRDFGWPEE